jgi:hypothetical protein
MLAVTDYLRLLLIPVAVEVPAIVQVCTVSVIISSISIDYRLVYLTELVCVAEFL